MMKEEIAGAALDQAAKAEEAMKDCSEEEKAKVLAIRETIAKVVGEDYRHSTFVLLVDGPTEIDYARVASGSLRRMSLLVAQDHARAFSDRLYDVIFGNDPESSEEESADNEE